jgi:5'-methylthioadenosine phosphorylase
MAYATVGLVTDYDCWLDDPSQHVSVDGIFALYGQTLALARRVLDELLRSPLPPPELESRQALAHALLTPESALDETQRGWMQVLKA